MTAFFYTKKAGVWQGLARMAPPRDSDAVSTGASMMLETARQAQVPRQPGPILCPQLSSGSAKSQGQMGCGSSARVPLGWRHQARGQTRLGSEPSLQRLPHSAGPSTRALFSSSTSWISTAHVRGVPQGRKETRCINILHESNALHGWEGPRHTRPGRPVIWFRAGTS